MVAETNSAQSVAGVATDVHDTSAGAEATTKRTRSRVSLVALVVLLMSLLNPFPAVAAPTDPVEISDTALRACVNAWLGKGSTNTTFTEGDLANATSTTLDCSFKGIVDITPLQFATGLTELNLSQNEIATLPDLSGLTSLTTLDLSTNQIVDVAPLAGVLALTTLNLNANQLDDLSPLQPLPDLTIFSATDQVLTQPEAIAGIGAPIPPLTRRDGGPSVEPSIGVGTGTIGVPPAVTWDGAGSNTLVWTDNVEESPLLTYTFSGTIVYPTVLEVTFPEQSLRQCVADALGVDVADSITEPQLAAYTGDLDCSDLGITDVSPLAAATGLANLTLDGNAIADVSPLVALTLDSFSAMDQVLPERTAVAGVATDVPEVFLVGGEPATLTVGTGTGDLIAGPPPQVMWTTDGSNTLEWEDLVGGVTTPYAYSGSVTYVTDPSPEVPIANAALLACVQTDLNLTVDPNTPVTEMQMAGLTELTCTDAGLTDADLEPLQKAPNLTSLDLSSNVIVEPLTNLGALTTLTTLTTLILDGNKITDLTDLADLASVTTFSAVDQVIDGGAAVSAVPAPIPPVTLDNGDAVVVSTIGTGTGTATPSEVTWTSVGANTMTWTATTSGLGQGTFGGTITYATTPSPNVTFADTNLQNCVSDALGVVQGNPINEAQMRTLTTLTCDSKGIVDLTGLDKATNLTSLSLNGNEIVDVAPLAGLTSLTILTLDGNKIQTVSPLAELANVTLFSAIGQVLDGPAAEVGIAVAIPDVTFDAPPVSASFATGSGTGTISNGEVVWETDGANTVTWTESVALAGGEGAFSGTVTFATVPSPPVVFDNTALQACVGDPVSQYELSLLTDVTCNGANITDADVAALLEHTDSLTSLDLSDNAIKDASAFNSEVTLETLTLDGNQISDLSGLTALSSLTGFSAIDQAIDGPAAVAGEAADIPTVTLDDASAVDVSTIGTGTGTVSGAQVTWTSTGDNTLTWSTTTTSALGAGPFAGAVTFVTAESPTVDITNADLKACVETAVGATAGADITELQLATMESLACTGAQLTEDDLGPIVQYATSLTALDLSDNAIVDPSSLSALTTVADLNLDMNQIADITGLTTVESLEVFSAADQKLDGGDAVVNTPIAIPAVTTLDGPATFTADPVSGVIATDMVTWTAAGPSSLTWTSTAGTGTFSGSVVYTASDEVMFADEALKSCVASALGVATADPITELQMEALTDLACAQMGITDVTGLESAVNLQTLDLSKNEIADVSPLADLANLVTVDLTDQTLTGDMSVEGEEVSVPVVTSVDGPVSPLTVAVGDGVLAGDMVTWNSVGANSLTWTKSGTLGSAEFTFNGTVAYDTVPAHAPGSFVTFAPVRVYDSRDSGGAFAAGETRVIPIAGQNGIPETAEGVMMNVTVTDTDNSGFLTLYPSGGSVPNASNLNWSPAMPTIANAANVKLGPDGNIKVFQSGAGTAQVIIDVVGYFAGGDVTEAGGFNGVIPTRLLDTREGAGPLPSGGSTTLQVAGQGGVPTENVSAVVMNVTVTGTTSGGFLTVYPSDKSRPNSSNLNWPTAGTTIPNLVTVKLGSDGKVKLAQAGGPGVTHVVVDVFGYYLGGDVTKPGMFVALDPARALDTRTGSGPVAGGSSINLDLPGEAGLPDTGIGAIVMNTTVTETTASGFLTVYPGDMGLMDASWINWSKPGTTIPNLVTSKVSPTGSVTIFNTSSGSTQVIADVAGYYLAEEPVIA